jgi:hypothetical protein
MSDQLHYIKMNGMSSVVACSIYWAIGLACPWCGSQPEAGHYGTGEITYPASSEPSSSGGGKYH